MHQELCPFCGKLREMELTGFRTVSINRDGKEEYIFTIVHRCRHCGQFVLSEDVKEEGAQAV